MIRYSQYLPTVALGEREKLANNKEVPSGEVQHIDELLDVDFIRNSIGVRMVRFHPTDRKLANLILLQGKDISIIALLQGDVTASGNFPEYIAPPVADVAPYVPPKDWGAPTPLDELFASGAVTKG